MGKGFVLICNNCGAKTEIVESKGLLYEDSEMVWYGYNIIQKGEVNIDIHYFDQVMEIVCRKCGQRIDDQDEVDFKNRL
jgi:DNA-directed RNA polymerase subunit RPC12/RpoP